MKLLELARAITPPFLWSLAKRLLGSPNRSLESAPDHIELRPGLHLRIHPESYIPFEYFRSLDSVMISEMDSFLELIEGKKALLDIGALHGVFSLAFTANHPERQALAVDASPVAFARLLYNIHANPACRIHAVEAAVSDRKSKLEMHYEWEHAVATLAQAGQGLIVSSLTGDELCIHENFFPDTLKIDVEGYELNVLRGLKKILCECHPLIFIEIHPARLLALNQSLAEVLQFLRTESYHMVGDAGSTKTASIDYQSKEDLRLVFIHKSA